MPGLRPDPEAIWLQRSETGLAVLRQDGRGARPIGETPAAREALTRSALPAPTLSTPAPSVPLFSPQGRP